MIVLRVLEILFIITMVWAIISIHYNKMDDTKIKKFLKFILILAIPLAVIVFEYEIINLREESEYISQMNMVDYSKTEIAKKKTLEDVAYTLKDANMYASASIKSKKIIRLSKGTKLTFYNKISDKWFHVRYKSDLGWMKANELRPKNAYDNDKVFLDYIQYCIQYIFPESTLWGKLFGYILSIPVSLIVGLILRFILGWNFKIQITKKFDIDNDLIETITPAAYFMFKNNVAYVFSVSEGGGFLIFWTISIFIASTPSMYLMKLIHKNFLTKKILK